MSSSETRKALTYHPPPAMPLMASMQQPSVMRSRAAAIRAQAQMKLYIPSQIMNSHSNLICLPFQALC